MHIGNIDRLEFPSTLINTDAYMNHSLLLCAVKVLHEER